jgi:hypothetical protein
MPAKKNVTRPKVAELKPLVRAFWSDAFAWKQNFDQLHDEEVEGDFGRVILFRNGIGNLKAQLNEIDKLLRGKEE